MVNVPCYSMGTAPRSNYIYKPIFEIKCAYDIVRESRATSKDTPGPG